MKEEVLLKPEEAAALGLAQQTLARWRCEGAGPPFVLAGRAVRYRRADLSAWIESRTRRSTSDPGAPANGEERPS